MMSQIQIDFCPEFSLTLNVAQRRHVKQTSILPFVYMCKRNVRQLSLTCWSAGLSNKIYSQNILCYLTYGNITHFYLLDVSKLKLQIAPVFNFVHKSYSEAERLLLSLTHE